MVGKASLGPPDSVSPRDDRSQLGKTRSLAAQGGEVTVDAARVVSNHSQLISPSRPRFALDTLCKVGPVLPF